MTASSEPFLPRAVAYSARSSQDDCLRFALLERACFEKLAQAAQFPRSSRCDPLRNSFKFQSELAALSAEGFRLANSWPRHARLAGAALRDQPPPSALPIASTGCARFDAWRDRFQDRDARLDSCCCSSTAKARSRRRPLPAGKASSCCAAAKSAAAESSIWRFGRARSSKR